jgi:S-formylglutathione hydrolase FrmB
MWSIHHLPAPETSLLVTSSRHGERDYKSTLEFIDAVKATNKTRISSIILDSGGHNFTTWKREIPPALEWMSGRLAES